jgi:Uma2 family endonuclease
VDNDRVDGAAAEDGGVTMSDRLTHPPAQPWSIEDLLELPSDGMRYELVDGSLLVSPHARLPHVRVVNRLRRILDRQAPTALAVGQDGGVRARSPRSYFVPDLWVVYAEALDRAGDYFEPADVLLVVEVLSEGNRGVDLLLKRHYYADGGIGEYWIVDPDAGAISVLRLDGDAYSEIAVVAAGEIYRAQTPFPIELDPADVF